MRLATLRTAAGLRAVARAGDHYIDLNASNPRLPSSLRELLADGPRALELVNTTIRQPQAVRIPVAQASYAPVVPNPQKILGIGLNYRDHAIEGGKPIPEEPVLFAKYPNVLIGHGDAIRLPAVSKGVDFEAELVVVIGTAGRNIAEKDALSHVAGYTCGHDVSARDWQFRGAERQWTLGKTFDSFGPTGPELVTADEIPDPQNLQVQMRLNGQTMQNSNTREFIFSVAKLIAFLTQVMTLEPGDLIFTGTPPGVGGARRPPVWLKAGDVCEIEIEKIGILRNGVE
jgi:2-keto-4-pentenoate hydratase/2-oxohepta-3-ene-1,7-dioic acid hydratase in catechol pathway